MMSGVVETGGIVRYALMCREHETMEFDVDIATCAVSDVRPLEHHKLAPLGVLDGAGAPERLLEQLFWGRCVSHARADLPLILDALGMRNQWELAFQSGGFSLSDPYWYRSEGSSLTWKDDNFFDNGWDPAFGRAVLRQDYAALGRASIATPDATCSGACRKAWVRASGGKRLLKAAVEEGGATAAGEALVSRMLSRMLEPGEYLQYDLVYRDDEEYSACAPLVADGEELAMAWQAISAAGGPVECDGWVAEILGADLVNEFEGALARLGVEGHAQAVAKMEVFAHLVFHRDVHPSNMGVIRSIDTGALRLAPLFDYDRAFGLSDRERMEKVRDNPKVAMLLVANKFSNLDPARDYSWYDPCALDGFEEEIERVLDAHPAVPRGYARFVADMFAAQRAYIAQNSTRVPYAGD